MGGLAKNVASQKVGFVMVDADDFATPETGISPSGVIRKDGGASAALSNTVSELTNGYYVVTLSQSETNANLVQLRFHDSGASCATQFLTFYTDRAELSDIHSTIDEILTDTGTTLANQLASILTDTGTTLDNKIDSVLADTQSLSNATYGLDALETIASDILEALDSVTAGPIASILVDTQATLDNKLDSILEDTKSIIVDASDIKSAVDDVESNLSNAISTLDGWVGNAGVLSNINSVVGNLGGDSDNITSILADTKEINSQCDSILADTAYFVDYCCGSVDSSGVTSALALLKSSSFGLDVLETIASDILSTLDGDVDNMLTSILVDTNTISNLGAGSDSAILSTLDGPVGNKLTSILSDTNTISNLGAGSDSAILSTLDGPIIGTIGNKVTSILADTITLSNATYGLDSLETITSDILEALDSVVAGPIASILVDTNTTLDNKIDSILADTAEINSQCDSILADTQSITTMQDELTSVLVDTRTLSNATYGLDALETITSDIREAIDSVTAGPIASILVDTNTTLDNKLDSILADTITISNATYGLDAIETIASDILEALDSVTAGPITSILADTGTTLDNKVDSILADTGELQTDDYPAAISAVQATVDSILEDTDGTHGVAIAAASLDAIWDRTEALTGDTNSYETMVTRLYRFFNNKLNITDATGAAALRNEADDGDIATGGITDNDTTTVRTALTWV